MDQLINTIKNYLSLLVSFLVGGSLLLFWLIDLNDNWFKGVLYCYLIYIIVFKSIEIIRTIKSGRFGVDILAIMAIVSCIFTGDMVAAYIIGLMISSGEALETLAGQRAKRELSALIKRQPTRVHLVNNDDVVEVELDKLKVGDIVRHYAGRTFKNYDFCHIIHITDTDGAFVPDNSVIYQRNSVKPLASAMGI